MQNNKKHSNLIENILLIATIIALIAVLFIAYSSTLRVAFADEAQYIKAPVSDLNNNSFAQKSTLLISTDEDSFYIPESYYVEIKSVAFSNTYYANYMGLECYVTIENPSFVKANQETAYPNVIVTIKDGENVTLNSIELKSDYSILFMGYSEDSTKAYCKAYNSSSTLYGFIDLNKLNSISIPYEAETQAIKDASSKGNDNDLNNEFTGSTSRGIRVAIIVCLSIAIVVITILLFVGKNKERHTSIRDEGQSYDEPKN